MQREAEVGILSGACPDFPTHTGGAMLHLASPSAKKPFGFFGFWKHISEYFSKPFLDLLGRLPVFSGIQSQKGLFSLRLGTGIPVSRAV